MAYEGSRISTYSNNSNASRSGPSTSTQVSTQTLLNALHTSYSQSKPLNLESSTSLVVNTWLTAAKEGPNGHLRGTIDAEIAHRVWEHARRRAEDGCVVLGFVKPLSLCTLKTNSLQAPCINPLHHSFFHSSPVFPSRLRTSFTLPQPQYDHSSPAQLQVIPLRLVTPLLLRASLSL